MPSTILTSKGQITLPVEIRREMGLTTGDRLEFTRNPETGGYEVTRTAGSIMDLKSSLKYDGPPVTVEQMNRDIAQYLADDDERIKRDYRETLESERRS
jgi:AbrB family looped-hinge helix DNA binding protein